MIAEANKKMVEPIKHQMVVGNAAQAFNTVKRTKQSGIRRFTQLERIAASLGADNLWIEESIEPIKPDAEVDTATLHPTCTAIASLAFFDERIAKAEEWARACRSRFDRILGHLKVAINSKNMIATRRLLDALDAFSSIFVAEAKHVIAALTEEFASPAAA